MRHSRRGRAVPASVVLAGAVVAAATVACQPEADIGLAPLDPFEQRARPTEDGAVFRYDWGADIESYDSDGGRFRVWYATTTADAVPLTDSDGSGVPDMVELVAVTFDDVYAYYIDTLGFRPPLDDTTVGASDDGGDSRFDVYLVDFGGQGDGAFGIDGCLPGTERCAGHMSVENDFVGYGYPSHQVAVTTLASHEFFHAIQAAYDSEQDSWWTEATATWGSEMYDPGLRDFEAFLHGYFELTEQSIDVPPVGPVDTFSYGLAIWPRFLSERFGDDIVREIWEGLENDAAGQPDPEPLGVIDRLLADGHGQSFADAFADFVVWNLFTGDFSRAGAAYENAVGYPEVELQWAGALPLEDDPRMFHASVRYYSADLDGRDAFAVGLVDDAPGELRVAVVLESAFDRSDPVWIAEPYATSPQEVAVDGEDRAIAVVVNVAMTGQSERPILCLGDPEEVSACVNPGGSTDAGTGGSGGDAPPPDDCACRGGAHPARSLLGVALLLVAVRRRRR